MKNEPLIFGLVVLIFGGFLLFWAIKARKIRGLGLGKTLALDDLTLFSEHLKIVGRPDRIVGHGDFLIPEEWKPLAKRTYHGHK
jgi:CRISPR-associated exonuclease Cas4